MKECKTIGCQSTVSTNNSDFCFVCEDRQKLRHKKPKLADLYPNYYKDVGELTEIDVYAVHFLFNIQDPSGAIQHASKKLLLSGVRTGGKSIFKDIREARDTLTRYLELHGELE